jgi:hypothetical protein
MSTQSIRVTSNKQCALCTRRIRKNDKTNLHHTPTLRSHGGQTVIEVHESCHRSHHKSNGDFVAWGRLSSLDKHWAFTLRGIKDNPLYEPARQFYRLYYSNPQSRKGMQ